MALIVLMFLASFATIALLLIIVSGNAGGANKQTMARLDAIRFGPQSSRAEEEPLDVRREDTHSSLPWLDKLLERLELTPKLQLLLYQAESKWSIGRLMLTSLISAFAASYLVYLRTEGTLLMIMMFVLAGAAPFLYLIRMRQRRFYRMKERLPEALDLMVSAIRAGHSFSSAMGMASRESPEPVKREFRQSFDEQNFGLDLRVAMTNLAYRVPIREIRMISAAVLIQKETGGNLTEILEKVSHLIREDFRLQRQVRVHTAQGRLTGWILSLLPLVLGIALYIVNPEHMSLLWKRPAGVYALEGACVLTVVGALIIRKIIRIYI